jgi:hypothetical protein
MVTVFKAPDRCAAKLLRRVRTELLGACHARIHEIEPDRALRFSTRSGPSSICYPHMPGRLQPCVEVGETSQSDPPPQHDCGG